MFLFTTNNTLLFAFLSFTYFKRTIRTPAGLYFFTMCTIKTEKIHIRVFDYFSFDRKYFLRCKNECFWKSKSFLICFGAFFYLFSRFTDQPFLRISLLTLIHIRFFDYFSFDRKYFLRCKIECFWKSKIFLICFCVLLFIF